MTAGWVQLHDLRFCISETNKVMAAEDWLQLLEYADAHPNEFEYVAAGPETYGHADLFVRPGVQLTTISTPLAKGG
jgi:hypothetical protein